MDACLQARCLSPQAPNVFDGRNTALVSTDDFLLRDGALQFARSSLERKQSFFAALVTTGTHHPYTPPPPTGMLASSHEPGSAYHRYLDRVRDADALARSLYEGLGTLSARVLFVVVGDHGEAFGDGGHYQHGSCVRPACLRVPLVLVAPPRGAAATADMAASAVQQPPLVRHQQPSRQSTESDGEGAGVAWRGGLSRHADVFETILQWSGHRLSNSSTHGTLLRRGRSLTSQPSLSKQECTESYAFFNPSMRASACVAAAEPAPATGQQPTPPGQPPPPPQQQQHPSRIDYLLYEPRRGVKAQQLLLTPNASTAHGILVDARSSSVAAEARELAARSRLEVFRLSVNSEYDLWRELAAAPRRTGARDGKSSSALAKGSSSASEGLVLRPVRSPWYNMSVKLQHVGTRCYLHSHRHLYPTGSKQQQVSCHGGEAEPLDCWRIKPAHKEDPALRGPVPHGAIIRLEHCATRCHLHSHLERSAVTSQLEVSCYGTGGRGDANDDWRLFFETTETGGAVRLQHVLTAPSAASSAAITPATAPSSSSSNAVRVRSHCLHSHFQNYPAWGLGHQEVTNYDQPTDAQDRWVLLQEQVQPLSDMVMSKARGGYQVAAGALQHLWRGATFEYERLHGAMGGGGALPASVDATRLPPLPPSLQPAAQRIVITLGTLPTRDCTAAVASLLQQTRTPDAIYVAAPTYSAWAQRPANIPPGLRAVGGERLRLLQPNRDLGPAEKYLGTLASETSSATIVIIVDDDWIYPPHFVQTISAALLAREAPPTAPPTAPSRRHVADVPLEHSSPEPPRQRASAVAVGGSGVRLPHNLSGFVVGKPGVACEPFLRHDTPVILSAHLERNRVARFLVDSPLPALQEHEASRDALHGALLCEVGRRVDPATGQPRSLPRMLTHFQLSLRWLQHNLSVWPALDTSGLRHVGEGCLPPRLLSHVAGL